MLNTIEIPRKVVDNWVVVAVSYSLFKRIFFSSWLFMYCEENQKIGFH